MIPVGSPHIRRTPMVRTCGGTKESNRRPLSFDWLGGGRYGVITKAGITLMASKTFNDYDYQHQKYWVVDGASTGQVTH